MGPILVNADSRRLKRQLTVESAEVRGNWKSEVRNLKGGIRRRECGQARPGEQAMTGLGAATMSCMPPLAARPGRPAKGLAGKLAQLARVRRSSTESVAI